MQALASWGTFAPVRTAHMCSKSAHQAGESARAAMAAVSLPSVTPAQAKNVDRKRANARRPTATDIPLQRVRVCVDEHTLGLYLSTHARAVDTHGAEGHRLP